MPPDVPLRCLRSWREAGRHFHPDQEHGVPFQAFGRVNGREYDSVLRRAAKGLSNLCLQLFKRRGSKSERQHRIDHCAPFGLFLVGRLTRDSVGVAAKLVVGSLYYLHDGEAQPAMSRLGTTKRGQILRQQLDQIRAAVRDQFAASCLNVQRIVGGEVFLREFQDVANIGSPEGIECLVVVAHRPSLTPSFAKWSISPTWPGSTS
jgi:hypothetical protein